MLAERLNEVALDLRNHYRSAKIGESLSAVHTSLNQLRSAGADANARRQVRNQLEGHLEELSGSLASDPSNEYAPSEIAVAKQIGGWHLTGERLGRQIQSILEQPAIEGQETVDRVKELHEEVESFYRGLASLLDGFDQLGVGRSTLPGESAEVGVLFAIEMGEATLGELDTEVSLLERHLRFFAEISGESPGKVRVRALSSSGWELFLDTPYAQAAAWSFAIKQCVEILKGALDLAIKYRELRNAGAQENLSEEVIEERVGEYIEANKDELLTNLMEKYEGDDDRAAELEVGLDRSLDYMIEKIREGTTFEVRVLRPEEGTEDEEVAPGFGNLSDLQERGRAMSGEVLQITADSRALLRSVAQAAEDAEGTGEEPTPEAENDAAGEARNENGEG